jgi:uncharacterized lipoprotein YajG
MRRFTTISILILLIAAFLLPSCGGQTSAATPSALAEQTPVVNSATTPSPESASATAEITGKKVRVFYTNDGLGEIDPCG